MVLITFYRFYPLLFVYNGLSYNHVAGAPYNES